MWNGKDLVVETGKGKETAKNLVVKEKFYYSWLMDLIKIFNREINSLEKIYNSINNNTEFLK